MANLRTNNLSGEQGQNAYRGSVFFNRGTASSQSDSFNFSGIAIGTSDFTIEGWLYKTKTDNYPVIFDTRESGNDDAGGFFFGTDSSNYLYFYTQSTNAIKQTIISNFSWYHFALVRTGGTTTLYLNGQVSGTYSDSNNYSNDITKLGTSQQYTGGVQNNWNWGGYLSNIRIVVGSAVYTSAFTPPTSELKAIPNTKLLCCQNSDDPTKEETGRTLTGVGNHATVGYNKTQPKVIPPFGVDAGNTFGGPIQQSSQGYMYFPTGRTEERGRGRGVYGGGGISSPTNPANIAYIDVQSQGNTTMFGDLTSSNRAWTHGFGSSTRAIWSGGGSTGGGTLTNTIDFVTIATTSNATDFGDATVATTWRGSFSNDTRGISGGGYIGPANLNTIDFVTIANIGNATDFGDLTQVRRGAGAMASSTRGVFAGGFTPSVTNIMDFVTIATTANATDFGDLVQASRHDSGGCSNGVRGIIGGGNTGSSNHTNVIQFITIASEGNATDFGDLNNAVEACGTLDNSIRGVFSGSYTPSLNTMDFITIATTGNALDFGDNTESNYAAGGTSDSHGGLS